MDKRMQLSEKMSMENNAANQESIGDMFVHRVASSGLVLKFKVDKYGKLPSKHTISSQEVMMSSGKQNVRELLDNFEANCSPSAIPLLEQSEISVAEATSSNKISHFDDAKVAPPDEIVTAAMVELPVTENDGNNGSLVHTCNECGKWFKEISSLHGHKGVHRREENKRMHMMMAEQQPIAVEASRIVSSKKPRETKKDEMMKTMSVACALHMLLMEFKWHQSDDLSTSMACSNKYTYANEEITDEMKEVSEILITLAQSFCKDSTMHVSSSASISKCFVCTTCKKKFPSYHALRGHMSIHSNRPAKNNLLEDGGAGSSGGGRERSTWKHMCDKCNEKFPNGQILGGHKRKHWWEEHYKMALLEDQNVKPPLPILPHHKSERSGLVVVPTDEIIQPGTRLVVAAAHTVPLPCYDAQQPQQATNLGNEIELPLPSDVSDEDAA